MRRVALVLLSILALATFWRVPSLFVLGLFLSPPAAVLFGWGPNRQWLWNRSPENIRSAMVVASGIGRWIAGISGVGIVLCLTLAISGYTALEGPGDRYCEASDIAGDAIASGLKLLVFFGLFAVMSLIAGFMPDLFDLHRWLTVESGRTEEQSKRTARWFFATQIGFMIASFWGIVLLLWILSFHSGMNKRSLYEGMKATAHECHHEVRATHPIFLLLNQYDNLVA